MVKTKIEKRKVEVTKDIVCNICGTSCKASPGYGFSYATLKAHWGYCSNRDGQVHEAHICNSCFDVMIKKFKISSLVTENKWW